MKILIANWVYNWGSTGCIVRDLMMELTKLGHQVIVVTAQNRGTEDSRVYVVTTPKEWRWFWRINRLGLTSKFRGSTAVSKRLLQHVDDYKPDVVNLHLLHGNRLNLYYLLEQLGRRNTKTVVTNHAELYYTGSCGHAYDCQKWISSECRGCDDKKGATGSYIFANPHRNWRLMQRAFSFFKPENLLFTAVSPWVKVRFLQSPIVKGFDCEVVLNGLDVNIFRPKDNFREIEKRVGTSDFVLYVTASFNPILNYDVKGGYYLVKLAEAMPEQKFVVVASSVAHAVALPKNIYVWGKAKDQNELAELYSAAQLTVLVSRRETFSMVTAESLCCGTPVVGFRAGGPETIAIPDYARFVEQKDVDGLMQVIKNMQASSFDRRSISDEARVKYSSAAMAKGYLTAYDKIIKQ